MLDEMDLEQTLALVKPDAIHSAEAIRDLITQNGFTILQERRVRMSPEQTSEFYHEHFGKAFFGGLITFMSGGPVLALVLARHNAIAAWREMLGPTDAITAKETEPNSIRGRFGTDNTRNAAHGSDSVASASREIRFFFPDAVIEPLPSSEATRKYLARAVNPTLVRGLTALCKAKPADPIAWLADWLDANNPNKPKVEEPQD